LQQTELASRRYWPGSDPDPEDSWTVMLPKHRRTVRVRGGALDYDTATPRVPTSFYYWVSPRSGDSDLLVDWRDHAPGEDFSDRVWALRGRWGEGLEGPVRIPDGSTALVLHAVHLMLALTRPEEKGQVDLIHGHGTPPPVFYGPRGDEQPRRHQFRCAARSWTLLFSDAASAPPPRLRVENLRGTGETIEVRGFLVGGEERRWEVAAGKEASLDPAHLVVARSAGEDEVTATWWVEDAAPDSLSPPDETS